MNYHLMKPSSIELLKKQYALAGIEKVFLLPSDCSFETGEPSGKNTADMMYLFTFDKHDRSYACDRKKRSDPINAPQIRVHMASIGHPILGDSITK